MSLPSAGSLGPKTLGTLFTGLPSTECLRGGPPVPLPSAAVTHKASPFSATFFTHTPAATPGGP